MPELTEAFQQIRFSGHVLVVAARRSYVPAQGVKGRHLSGLRVCVCVTLSWDPSQSDLLESTNKLSLRAYKAGENMWDGARKHLIIPREDHRRLWTHSVLFGHKSFRPPTSAVLWVFAGRSKPRNIQMEESKHTHTKARNMLFISFILKGIVHPKIKIWLALMSLLYAKIFWRILPLSSKRTVHKYMNTKIGTWTQFHALLHSKMCLQNATKAKYLPRKPDSLDGHISLMQNKHLLEWGNTEISKTSDKMTN